MAKKVKRQRTESSSNIRQKTGRALRSVLSAVLVMLLAAIFSLVVIMSEPKHDETDIIADQPLTAAASSVTIHSEEEMTALLKAFPVPLLAMLPVEGVTFTDATSYDVPFEDGVARVTDVRYAFDQGGTLTLTSIYPARASSLLERDGYALIGTTELAGLPAVRMSREDSVRVHAQHAEAIYVLTAPSMTFGDLSALARSAQRMSFAEE